MPQKLPVQCPSCTHALDVAQLLCSECGTSVSGSFDLPVLLQLSRDEQQFILEFLLTSGSLKEMASKMGISYPTVRNKLDDTIAKVKSIQPK